MSTNINKYLAQAAKTTQAGGATVPALWTPSITSFGPGEPIRPSTPREAPRREQYDVSRNINWVPRSEEHRVVTYSQMRSLSRIHGVTRTVIEKRKDEIKGLDWEISVKPEYETSVADPTEDVKKATKFFNKPDLETPFDQWENAILEDIYVIDAPALYKERDRLGRFRSLQNIDGATFKMLVNDSGRVPQAPYLAYEQVIYGMPHTGYIKPIKGINPFITGDAYELSLDTERSVYTNYEELYYRPFNVSTDGVYGWSHVESIIMTVEVALRRDVSFKEWFKSGNVPAGFIPVPETWSPDQIISFMNTFNAALAGDLSARSQLVAYPGVGTVQTLSPLTFDSVFDQWLARIVCARFNVSPIPYISQLNRSVGEQMEEASRDEGLVPMMKFLSNWYTDILDNCLEMPWLQFKWNPGQNYGKDDASMDTMIQEHGGMTINDLRLKQGKKPLANGIGDVPLILNGGTWTRIEDVVNGLAGGAQQPLGGVGASSSGDDELPQLSIKPGGEPGPYELTADPRRVEMKAWEKFEINRFGKKKTRPFVFKAISLEEAKNIYDNGLSQATSVEDIKAIFDTIENMDRERAPGSVNLVELEEDYKVHLAKIMNQFLHEEAEKSNFRESEHPRANDGEFTAGSGGSGSSDISKGHSIEKTPYPSKTGKNVGGRFFMKDSKGNQIGEAHCQFTYKGYLKDDRRPSLGYQYPPNTAIIDSIEINEKQKGKGLGKKFLTHMENEARSVGMERLYATHVMGDGDWFWEKMGYHQIDDSGYTWAKDFKSSKDFNETDHPRAGEGQSNGGQFVSGGGGSPATSESKPVQTNKPANDHLTHTLSGKPIPPAWTNVTIATSEDEPIQATGYDKVGKKQYIYSTKHSEAHAADKFARIRALKEALPGIMNKINQDKTQRDEAAVLYLIQKTGFRIGSNDDTKAKVKAYGASTLLSKQVTVEGTKCKFDFIGKKGVRIVQEVDDSELAGILSSKLSQPDSPVFNVNDDSIRNYLHEAGNFHPKDFRTWTGTETALKEVNSRPAPTNQKEYDKMVHEVAVNVSKKLGNTPTVALDSYIDPSVFSKWRDGLNGGKKSEEIEDISLSEFLDTVQYDEPGDPSYMGEDESDE